MSEFESEMSPENQKEDLDRNFLSIAEGELGAVDQMLGDFGIDTSDTAYERILASWGNKSDDETEPYKRYVEDKINKIKKVHGVS